MKKWKRNPITGEQGKFYGWKFATDWKWLKNIFRRGDNMTIDRSPKFIARKISENHVPRSSIVEDFITIGEEVITDLMFIDDMTNEEKHDLGKKVIVSVANASKGFKIPLPKKWFFLRPIVAIIKNRLLNLLADFVIKAIFKDAPSK